MNILRKLIAQNKREIGIKPIDIYTCGHILTGTITYLLLMLMGFSNWFSLLGAIFFGIIWEYFENFILAKTKLKINKMKDSLENSLTDIVFTIIGGYIGLFFGIYAMIVVIAFMIIIFYELIKRVMG